MVERRERTDEPGVSSERERRVRGSVLGSSESTAMIATCLALQRRGEVEGKRLSPARADRTRTRNSSDAEAPRLAL